MRRIKYYFNKIKNLILYPHQLFERKYFPDEVDTIWFVEDPLYFGDKNYPLNFHKQKLVLHRASMKSYADELGTNYNIKYIEYKDKRSRSSHVFAELENKQSYIFNPVDFILEKRIDKYSEEYNVEIKYLDSPNFILSEDEINDYFEDEKYFFTSFYKQQREKLEILLDESGKPEGGKLTYDKANRKKLKKDTTIPTMPDMRNTKFVDEAIEWVDDNFADNPGTTEKFIYPTNRKQSLDWIDRFFNERFMNFGPFEDAFEPDEAFLFHSVFTPFLNIGLISPMEIVDRALEEYNAGRASIESTEGFVRQIIGWREFMRGIYRCLGVNQRKSNYFEHKRKLDDSWYKAKTGIKPVDESIKRILKYAYSHHIERLMVHGNIMLLMEIEPDEVYKWFMEMFIDAYDWVMVPNVYGMSQYSDGGDIVTKPYISGSNYVFKMSHYKKGDEWAEVWDALYWRFIDKHKDKFKNNQRMGLIVSLLKRKNKEDLKEQIKLANKYLDDY